MKMAESRERPMGIEREDSLEPVSIIVTSHGRATGDGHRWGAYYTEEKAAVGSS